MKLILVPVLLVAAMLWLPGAALARAKTDLVFIGKADRITGEIKQLSRGILQLSTDNIGTVNIEWEDVDSLSSVYQFRVEDQFGRKYFGAIFMTKSLELQVISAGETQRLAASFSRAGKPKPEEQPIQSFLPISGTAGAAPWRLQAAARGVGKWRWIIRTKRTNCSGSRSCVGW